METTTLPTMNMRVHRAAHSATQAAIQLKATTAAVCGSALKRWSIVWSN